MCFDKLIGIKNACNAEVPTSGLYVDDYGVTITLLDQVITEDYDTGYDLFVAKRNAAAELMAAEFQNHIGSWLKADTIIDNTKVGFTQPGTTPVYQSALGAGKYTGATLRTYTSGSFVNIYLSDVLIKAETDEEITVHIVDLTTNKVIESFHANTNEHLYINKTYRSNRNDLYIGIVYESTINGLRTIVKEGYCQSCNDYQEVYCNRVTLTRSVTLNIGEDETVSNVKGAAYTGGLQVNFSVNCDRRAWLCSISNLLAIPLIFKTSAEIMNFIRHEATNSRGNTTVTINIESIEKRYEFYMAEYEKALNLVLKNMAMPKDANCFRCEEKVKWSFMLP